MVIERRFDLGPAGPRDPRFVSTHHRVDRPKADRLTVAAHEVAVLVGGNIAMLTGGRLVHRA